MNVILLRSSRIFCVMLLSFYAFSAISLRAEPTLPELTVKNLKLEYLGAFRISNSTFGDSRIGYTGGTFTVRPGGASFFVTSHINALAVAEFPVPELAGEDVIADLPVSSTPIQPFTKILDRAPSGNPQKVDRLTGMELYDGSLVINWMVYYDGEAKATDTTLVLKDSSDLAGSPITGFHKLQAPGTGHISGWMSSVPKEWQSALDTKHIVGYASNLAINGRSSIGPTAFGFDLASVVGMSGFGATISTDTFLDYPLTHDLHKDPYNTSRTNNLWTEISTAQYGFIVPGTNSYMVVGTSGGHVSGIGYKITQANGMLCGGPCAYDYHDNYNYVWFWRATDLVAVKNGKMQPYEPMPYSYGKLALPFQPAEDDPFFGYHAVIGADFDPVSQRLFILLSDVDRGQYENSPVMVVYRVPEISSPPAGPSDVNVLLAPAVD